MNIKAGFKRSLRALLILALSGLAIYIFCLYIVLISMRAKPHRVDHCSRTIKESIDSGRFVAAFRPSKKDLIRADSLLIEFILLERHYCEPQTISLVVHPKEADFDYEIDTSVIHWRRGRGHYLYLLEDTTEVFPIDTMSIRFLKVYQHELPSVTIEFEPFSSEELYGYNQITGD